MMEEPTLECAEEKEPLRPSAEDGYGDEGTSSAGSTDKGKGRKRKGSKTGGDCSGGEQPSAARAAKAQKTEARRKGKGQGQGQGKRNKELGFRGEEAAACFLVRRGYDIVARNWTCFAGEADIIARDGSWLVFVEVKTRSNYAKGMPSEAVGKEKRHRYEKIAAAFLAQYDEAIDIPLRFDVVSILAVAPDRAMIRHHIDAFAAA